MFEKTQSKSQDDTTREDAVMAARTMPADLKAARITELEAELELLKLPPYLEYPKTLPDGRIVESAEAEQAATEAAEKAAEQAEKDAEKAEKAVEKAEKAKR